MTIINSVTDKPLERSHKMLLAVFVALLGAIAIGAAMTRQPLFALAGIAGIFTLLALIKWPDIATLLVVFYIYLNVGPVAIRYHGVPTLAAMAFPMILLIPLVWYLVLRRQKLVITPILILLLVFAVIYSLGAVFSRDISLTLPQLTEFFVEGLLLYFLLTNIIRTPQMLKRVVWVLLISGAVIGSLGIYQQVTNTFDNEYGGFAQVKKTFGTGVQTLQGEVEQPRLAGSIGEKNRYAQNMLMLVPLGLFQLWIYRSPGMRILALILTGLIMAGGALAFSRGAAVGFVLMILIMVLLRYIKLYQLLPLLIIPVLVLWMFPQYSVRLASMGVFFELDYSEEGTTLTGVDDVIIDRLSEMLAAMLIFRDHPVLGVGPGMVKYYTQDYAKEVGLSQLATTYQAHSLFPGIAAETGILGLICFSLILFVPLRDLARMRKQWLVSYPDRANLATAFFLALVAYIITGFFLHLSYFRFFYLIIALAVLASRLGTEESAELGGVEKETNHLVLAQNKAGLN